MLTGWKELTERQDNPAWKPGDPWHKRWLDVRTGEIQCPECFFTTRFTDPFGTHICPDLTDGHGTHFSIGDEVYVYAKSRIRKGEVTRYKKETGMLTVMTLDKDGRETKHVINDLRKVLVMTDGNEEGR